MFLVLSIIIFLVGITITEKMFPKLSTSLILPTSFLSGSIILITAVYILASLRFGLMLGVLLSCCIGLGFIYKERKRFIVGTKKLFSLKATLIVFIAATSIATVFFFRTFAYNTQSGEFLIASNIYLDFGAHIPFIRSFSLGDNFPAEVPFFAGKKLPYYFLFDFYIGVLERLGLRIDYALNIVSALSLVSLSYFIYEVSILLFKKKRVGVLSIIFFFFSSNLAWITFFQQHGFSLSTFKAIWHNSFFLEGVSSPLAKDIIVAGFLNLNTYNNQRHLLFGIAIFFLLIYHILLLKKKVLPKLLLFLGILLGLLSLWHTMVFISFCLLLAGFALVFSEIRKNTLIILGIGCLIAMPQIYFIRSYRINSIVFEPGFIISHILTIQNFITFWVTNLGISVVLCAIGVILSPAKIRKYFAIFSLLFIAPNLFHFSSRYPFDDHKFLSIFIIFMGMFSAFAIVTLLSIRRWGILLASCAILLMICSGILSLFVIKNDIYARIPDYTKNSLMSWTLKNIPPNEVLITNGEIYDPVSLVGKKTFIGRGHYIFVYGGNPEERLTQKEMILQASHSASINRLVDNNQIKYFVFYKNDFAKNAQPFHSSYYTKNYHKIYEDPYGVVYEK